MLEALATSDGKFILTVTRMQVHKSIKKVKVKRKNFARENTLPTLIYKFDSFDDFYDLSNCLNINIFTRLNKVFVKSSLYLYNNSYFILFITRDDSELADINSFFSTIT